MTVRAINEALGINGAYLPARLAGLDHNPRVFRARKRKGVLQFNTLKGWIEAPRGWILNSGVGAGVVAKHSW